MDSKFYFSLDVFKAVPTKSSNILWISLQRKAFERDIQIVWRNPVDKLPVSIVMEMQIQRNPLAYDDEGEGATVQSR